MPAGDFSYYTHHVAPTCCQHDLVGYAAGGGGGPSFAVQVCTKCGWRSDFVSNGVVPLAAIPSHSHVVANPGYTPNFYVNQGLLRYAELQGDGKPLKSMAHPTPALTVESAIFKLRSLAEELRREAESISFLEQRGRRIFAAGILEHLVEEFSEPQDANA